MFSIDSRCMPLMRCIGWDAFISVIYLTVGSLKEDKGKVQVASDIEVDEDNQIQDLMTMMIRKSIIHRGLHEAQNIVKMVKAKCCCWSIKDSLKDSAKETSVCVCVLVAQSCPISTLSEGVGLWVVGQVDPGHFFKISLSPASFVNWMMIMSTSSIIIRMKHSIWEVL